MLPASKENQCYYNPALKMLARKLRKNPTAVEKRIWNLVLRKKMLNGHSFTRQRPVLKYIADFMCKEKLLVIEIDGISHLNHATIVNDKRKTEALERIGFKVLRFSDSEVFYLIEWVRDEILKSLDTG